MQFLGCRINRIISHMIIPRNQLLIGNEWIRLDALQYSPEPPKTRPNIMYLGLGQSYDALCYKNGWFLKTSLWADQAQTLWFCITQGYYKTIKYGPNRYTERFSKKDQNHQNEFWHFLDNTALCPLPGIFFFFLGGSASDVHLMKKCSIGTDNPLKKNVDMKKFVSSRSPPPLSPKRTSFDQNFLSICQNTQIRLEIRVIQTLKKYNFAKKKISKFLNLV